MGHLAAGVDAGIGPPGHRQRGALGHPQRHGQGLLERLPRPYVGPAGAAQPGKSVPS